MRNNYCLVKNNKTCFKIESSNLFLCPVSPISQKVLDHFWLISTLINTRFKNERNYANFLKLMDNLAKKNQTERRNNKRPVFSWQYECRLCLLWNIFHWNSFTCKSSFFLMLVNKYIIPQTCVCAHMHMNMHT